MILIFLFCLIEKKTYKKSRNADIGRLKKKIKQLLNSRHPTSVCFGGYGF